ncbi:MAG: hypothetical protein ACJ8D1_00835, partial [Microvirga sp.]
MGQIFTFQQLNERRLLSSEADRAVTSQECDELPFGRNLAPCAWICPQVAARAMSSPADALGVGFR